MSGSTDTDQQPAPAPPPPLPAGVDPDMLRNALAYLNQTPPPVTVDQTPVDTSGFGGKFRNVIGILGNALGGGGDEGIPQSPTQKEDAGIRALMRFGTGLMAASHYVPGQTAFSNLAAGFQGAADSEQDSQRTSAALLGARQQYQEQQQQQAIERIKTALPLLQLQQLQAAKNAALGVGNTPAPGSSISTGGSIGQGTGGSVLDTLANIESGDKNIVSNVDKDSKGLTLAQGGNPAEISQGNFQIQTATWKDFAKQAGVDVNQYPTAMSAPREVQAQVASVIPLSRFGSRTQTMLRQQFGPLDGGKTIGELTSARSPPPPAPGTGGNPPLPVPPIPPPGGPPAVNGRPVLPAPQPPVAATGNQFGGPGAPTNGVIPPSPPGSAADVATIRGAMVGAGADPTTLAPGQGSAPAPQGTTVVAGTPQPPTPLTPQPTTPPTPGRVPSTFTPQRVPLPPDIQARVDNPLPPDQLQRLNTAISTAQTPEALQAAQKARDDAVATARAAALSQGEAYQTQAGNIQKEVWKAQIDAQNQEDAAVAADARKNQQERDMAGINNVNAQVNAQRDQELKDDKLRLTGMRTAADAATNTSNVLQILRNVEKSMPATGDAMLNDHPGLLSYLPSVVSEQQARQMTGEDLFTRLATSLGTQLSEQAAKGAGTARTAEIQQNMASVPTIGMPHEARVQMLGFLQNLAQFPINRADAAEDYYYNTPHPSKALAATGLTSLVGFDRWYENNGPSIIPRIAPGTAPADIAKIVKPGMLAEVPVPRIDPATKQQAIGPNGQPVYDYVRQVRE